MIHQILFPLNDISTTNRLFYQVGRGFTIGRSFVNTYRSFLISSNFTHFSQFHTPSLRATTMPAQPAANSLVECFDLVNFVFYQRRNWTLHFTRHHLVAARRTDKMQYQQYGHTRNNTHDRRKTTLVSRYPSNGSFASQNVGQVRYDRIIQIKRHERLKYNMFTINKRHTCILHLEIKIFNNIHRLIRPIFGTKRLDLKADDKKHTKRIPK